MEETKTYVFGNEGEKSGLGSGFLSGMLGGALSNGLGFGNLGMLGSLGNFGGLGNFGMNGIVDLFGLGIIASMFGWNNGNGLGLNGNGNAAAGFLSNQLNNDSGRELIMNAITSQGEANRTAVQTLSTMLGQDFNLVNAGIQSAQNTLNQIANNLGMSTLQMINAVQNGDANIVSTLQSCCCNTQKQIMEQGYQSQIATLNQTNQLGSQADRNTNAIIGAINAQTVAMNDQFCAAKERELQSKINTQADIITQLRGQISNDKQTEAFNAAFNVLNQKITELAAKQPNTVPVTYPNLVAVNNTPYNGGFYGNGFGNNIVF